MCGFFFIKKKKKYTFEKKKIDSACKLLVHRGPDDNKIFSNELLYSSLGFLAPIPFFLIPSFNILYLNPIKNYKNLDYIIHPDYTYSLGLAVPINLFLLFLCFVSLKIGENNFKKNDFLYPLIVAPYYLITSNSIKSFAFIASLYSFIMIN